MNEMIDRVARALAPEVWDTEECIFGRPDSNMRKAHEHAKEVLRGQARSAIQELTYPTHAMLDAGVRAVADASTRPSYDPVDTAWHAMIEEALRP